MIWYPKYNYDDFVEFDIVYENRKYTLQGKIYIIDRYGTFEQNKDVSYDIIVDKSPFHNDGPCLYKNKEVLKRWRTIGNILILSKENQ